MTRLRSGALLAIVLAGLLVSAGLATTLGYVDQRQTQVLLTGPSVIKCNQKATIVAKVVRTENGKPVANQAIRWSLAKKMSPSDRLNDTQTSTNRTGQTSVKIIFGPKAGQRIVKASVPGQSPQITLRCRGGLG